MLEPFFTYFGGKARTAYLYPPPEYKTIIEPFCGSAGYSLRYPSLDVLLIDKYPIITEVWKYLIRSTPEEILALPDIHEGYTVNDLDVCDAARYLIGFWLNKGTASPCQKPSAWMRAGTHETSFWGAAIRSRIARQLPKISHWKVLEGNYDIAPSIEATWFIDPPYINAGKDYKHASKNIDYRHLADFCTTRQGQVIVCENEGATWLPFRPYLDAKGTEGKTRSGTSEEVIWLNKEFSLFD